MAFKKVPTDLEKYDNLLSKERKNYAKKIRSRIGGSMDKRKKRNKLFSPFSSKTDGKIKPWGNFDLPKELRKPIIPKPKKFLPIPKQEKKQLEKVEKEEKAEVKKLDALSLKKIVSILKNKKLSSIKKLEYIDIETGEVKSLKSRLKNIFTIKKRAVLSPETKTRLNKHSSKKDAATKQKKIGAFDAYTNNLAKTYARKAAKSALKTTFGDLRIF